MFGVRPVRIVIRLDMRVIRSRWKRFNKGPLTRAGLLVRKIARQSIRRGVVNKKGERKPGKTFPKSWGKGKNPPFKRIISVPNMFGTSVIVGMLGWPKGGTPVPGLHEHGGTGRVTTFGTGQSKRRRKVLAHYRKRAFMRPALIKGKTRFPELWRGSFTR